MRIKKFFYIVLGLLVSNAGLLFAEDTNFESVMEEPLVSFFRERAQKLQDAEDLSDLIERAYDNRLVLLGEASHGTAEYYTWRKKISRRLIEEKDFSFIVVEGDWPSCFVVNKYVKGKIDADNDSRQLLIESFKRWPQWMWANEEVLALVEWLREYNSALPEKERVGFYGMDVYSFEESIREVKDYLDNFDDEVLLGLKEKYRVFKDYDYDGFAYARGVYIQGRDYREEVAQVVETLREYSDKLKEKDEYEFFRAKQNARIVKNAEHYYRSAVMGGPAGWNSRVRHMEETVYRLLDYYGSDSRGIVWAHNTHIGDARATSMIDRGQINIGQLARQELGADQVYIVGFSTYEGTVMAGREWGASRQVMEVPQAREDSFDNYLARVDMDAYWLYFTENDREKEYLKVVRGQRAIGVVYNPEREHLGNYVPTSLPNRYDAILFFRQTESVNPLGEK